MNYRRILNSFVVIGVFMNIAVHAAPKECSAKSGNRTVAVIELYTSEGCNSCPPADEWFSNLKAKGFDNNRVIPLGLHVDYWHAA